MCETVATSVGSEEVQRGGICYSDEQFIQLSLLRMLLPSSLMFLCLLVVAFLLMI